MSSKYEVEMQRAKEIVARTPGILSTVLKKMLADESEYSVDQMGGMLSVMYDRRELFTLRAKANGTGIYEVYGCVPPTDDPSRLLRRHKVLKAKPNGSGSVIPKMSAQLSLDVVPAGGTLHVHTGPRPATPDGASLPPITGHFTVPLNAPPPPRGGMYLTLELHGVQPIRLSLDEARKVYDQLATVFHPQR